MAYNNPFHTYPPHSNGHWYIAGVTDGKNGYSRTLPPPDDIYQKAYDEGFKNGLWENYILNRITI